MAAKPKKTLSKLQRGLKKIFKKGGGRNATVLPLITELRKLSPLFAPSTPNPKPNAASSQQQQKQPHAKRGQRSQAVLAKKKGYAQNGSDFIRGLDGRLVYNSFGHLTGIRTPEEISDIAEVCSFPGPRVENFDPGAKIQGKNAGQRYPYPWEAHHLIPGSALYLEEAPGKPVFTVEQYEILLQSTYDINNGHNIIMLPNTDDESVYFHCLIAHPSDHRGYTKLVMDGLKAIATEIEKLVAQAQPHDDIVRSFAEELEQLEEDSWDVIVKLGKAVVGAALQGLAVVDGPINTGLRLS